MKKFVYLFIGLLGYLFITQTTIANSLSLSIDPSIIEINALPPSTATSNFTIQNKSDGQITLLIQLKQFKAKLENARPPATSTKQSNTKQEDVAGEVGRGELEYLGSEDSSMLSNIQVLDNSAPVESVTLGPAQQKNLTLNVNVPADTNVSDYYFSMIFISQNTSTPASNVSLNQLGIASNVLLSVGAKETPNASLEEFSSSLFFEKGPVPFTIRIKNKGTHFIKPKAEVLIRNMFGQGIGKLSLKSVNILSNSTRTISNALWKEDFLLGLYTATLNVSLSDDTPSFTKSIHFIAFPFQGMIIIVIISIAGIVIWQRLKVYMKK